MMAMRAAHGVLFRGKKYYSAIYAEKNYHIRPI